MVRYFRLLQRCGHSSSHSRMTSAGRRITIRCAKRWQSPMIGTLHHFRHTLNIDCRRKIAHAFILPHLRYCLPVWGNTSAGVQSQLDHTLLRAARVISKDRQATFGPDSYNATGVLSFKTFLFINNVCRLFHFINENTASFYDGTETNECRPNTVHSTRSACSRKLVPLLVKRKADELCFQVANVRQ